MEAKTRIEFSYSLVCCAVDQFKISELDLNLIQYLKLVLLV